LEEPFTYDDLIVYWNKHKDRLDNKGYKIISSLMGMSKVELDGTTIKYEVPNESSKIDLESEVPSILGYLKGHLKNHHIKIEIIVNETIQVKKLMDKRDIFLHMAEKNPALELLRKTFDLNI
jgi:DNA polymerase-3 subunit gamma/tau